MQLWNAELEQINWVADYVPRLPRFKFGVSYILIATTFVTLPPNHIRNSILKQLLRMAT